MELGLYTFGVNMPDPDTGKALSTVERYANLLEEVELADQLGLDVFAVGEHHRPEYVVSSPATFLAAAAARTKNIRLSSAVTVLSSDDPVRVMQQYATIDLISGGRAEIMAGRGSFIESFPLFGYDLSDYDSLFDEKLQLLAKLREGGPINWPGGRHTPPLEHATIYPEPMQKPFPVWVAVGGTPNSVARAGVFGLPLAIAIIGGEPERFAPLAELYRQAATKSGHDATALLLSINVHGLIAETAGEARDLAFQSFSIGMQKIARERGFAQLSRHNFDAQAGSKGAFFVGDPQQIIDKILYEHEFFNNTRFLMQMSVGPLPHKKLMKAIELYGDTVAPAVRKAVGK